MLKLRKAPSSYDERFMDTMATEYLDRTPWTELRLEAVRDLLDPQPDDRVLDLGCAAGAITHYLSTFGAEPVGIDFEPLAIERARELFPGLRFEVADATQLPFADASFDKAVAADFVEHIEDDTFVAMCTELRRVLVPGGLFAIYAPNPRHLIERMKERDFVLAQNPTHIGLRDADHMRRVLERGGFDVLRSEWRPSFFRGLRSVEKVAGPKLDLFRYRLCVLAQAR
jgi:SAM-dependent methyltransferase